MSTFLNTSELLPPNPPFFPLVFHVSHFMGVGFMWGIKRNITRHKMREAYLCLSISNLQAFNCSILNRITDAYFKRSKSKVNAFNIQAPYNTLLIGDAFTISPNWTLQLLVREVVSRESHSLMDILENITWVGALKKTSQREFQKGILLNDLRCQLSIYKRAKWKQLNASPLSFAESWKTVW